MSLSAITRPFSAHVDLGSGRIEPAAGPLVTRRLGDMEGYYQTPITDPDRLVYEVHYVESPTSGADLASCTTILYPGKVGKEYHMTKGHFHAVRDRAEIYFGLSGEGQLVLALEDGDTETVPMRPGTANYIPGHWAHRSVNTGDEPLVFYAVYFADAGYDYGTIAEQGFPVVLEEGADGLVVRPNPRYRGGSA